MAVFLRTSAAARGFATPHELAHYVRILAVLWPKAQVPVRTERSSHRRENMFLADKGSARGLQHFALERGIERRRR